MDKATEQSVYNLRDYLDTSDAQKVLADIKQLAVIVGATDFTVIEKLHGDIVRLFNGEFPGYRASNTKYHNLEHTSAVALAEIRLIHGLWVEGHKFSSEDVLYGIITAFFHDTGLIQKTDDTEGTGAKYTIGHEFRSIELLRNYLTRLGFGEEAMEDCSNIILYTMMSKRASDIPSRREGVKLLGRILGTADLLAQIADRNYLERLPLLFYEFQEGGVPGYQTEMELLMATENFYDSVFKKRVYGELGGIAEAMRSHFKVRWNIEEDLYIVSVQKNIAYLNKLKENCGGDFTCYLRHLRRGNILRDFYGELK